MTATIKLLSVNLSSKHTCCYFIVAAYTGTTWQHDVGCWSTLPLIAHQGPESEYRIQSQLMPAWIRPLLLLSNITVSDRRQACGNHLSSCVSLCVHEICKRIRCMVLSQDLSLVLFLIWNVHELKKEKRRWKCEYLDTLWKWLEILTVGVCGCNCYNVCAYELSIVDVSIHCSSVKKRDLINWWLYFFYIYVELFCLYMLLCAQLKNTG